VPSVPARVSAAAKLSMLVRARRFEIACNRYLPMAGVFVLSSTGGASGGLSSGGTQSSGGAASGGTPNATGGADGTGGRPEAAIPMGNAPVLSAGHRGVRQGDHLDDERIHDFEFEPEPRVLRRYA